MLSLCALALIGGGFGARTAQARAKTAQVKTAQATTAVLPVHAQGLSDEENILFEGALRRALSKRGETLLARDETVAFVVGARSVGIDCDQRQLSCLAQLAGACGTDRVFHVGISPFSNGHSVNLRLVNSKNGVLLKSTTETVLGDANSLKAAAPMLVAKLFHDKLPTSVNDTSGAHNNTGRPPDTIEVVTIGGSSGAEQPPNVNGPPLWMLGLGGGLATTGLTMLAGTGASVFMIYRSRDTATSVQEAVDGVKLWTAVSWGLGITGTVLLGAGAATTAGAFFVE